jgi:capsular polysaccharide biosynthesis protein
MELAQMIKAIKHRWWIAVAVVLLATAAAAAVKLRKHSVPTGTATAQLMVDSPQSVIADLRQDTVPLTTRASVFAQFMASSLIQQRIAVVMGVPATKITTEGPLSGSGQALNVVTPSEARGQQIAAQARPYRLTFVAQDQLPLVTVSAQAPTPSDAAKLADAVYPAVTGYLQSLQRASTPQSALIPLRNRVTLRQLGPSQLGSQNSNNVVVLMIAAFIGILILGLLLILGLEKLRPGQTDASGSPHAESANGYAELPEIALHQAASGERPIAHEPSIDPVYELHGAGNRDVEDAPRSPSPAA